MNHRIVFRILLAFFVVASMNFSTDLVHSASKKSTDLSGKLGKVRGRLPRWHEDPCAKGVEAYKQASGHSAYAQSDVDYEYGVYVCGLSLNRGSVADAEKRAVQQCQASMKRWRHHHKGRCRVYASK